MNLKQQRARQKKMVKSWHRRQYNPDDLRFVAAHEAAHAVAAVAYGFPLESVEVLGRRLPGGIVAEGSTRVGRPAACDVLGRGAEAALPLMVQALSGPVAEADADPNYNRIKAGKHARHNEDVREAYSAAICAIGEIQDCDTPEREDTFRTHTPAVCGLDEAQDGVYTPVDVVDAPVAEVQDLFERALSEARLFVTDYRAVIAAVGAALIEKGSLTGDEVAALVATEEG